MEKKELHPRNRHRGRYDFADLVSVLPELGDFVAKNAYGDESIEFANPDAVRELNRALLLRFYGVSEWGVPQGYLCPPIPGRADYIHHVADILASSYGGKLQEGPSIRVLDIGVGANGVYPMIGSYEYGWSFVGTDIDRVALDSFQSVLSKNPELSASVELRHQKEPRQIFKNVVAADEQFELVISNPPFHASREEAEEGSRRKWKNLGRASNEAGAPVLNFGGQNSELWCPGGERVFIGRMIEESVALAKQVRWFSTLVAKETHLPSVLNALKRAKVRGEKIIEMNQGQKKSRLVAWTYR
jgi:23S rRNA (adenine1618-N6)-methyltransferase